MRLPIRLTMWSALAAACAGCATTGTRPDMAPVVEPARSAIFLHPDGMGANTWAALRLHAVGPDGRLAWDQLPRLAIYVGPMLDSVAASSNGGATTHAYGVRAALDSYGSLDGRNPPRAASGKALSVMREAQAAGKAIALVNSSSLTEPGTGAFLASVDAREDENDIAAQILAARPDIALGGGERYFLPRGVRGAHGEGVREDGRNLVEEARQAGYAVVHTREELLALPESTARILGLFAHEETFNEADEEALRAQGLPPFQPQAPRFDEMVAAALARLRHAPRGFLLVANEEATDNLSGENNTPGVLEAAAGADRAIALALAEARRNPFLTVIVASDSDNGGMNATGDDLDELPRPLPPRSPNGSPLDSDQGQPFLTPPDARGVRQPFYVVWASGDDMGGGTVARGIGPGAERIAGTIDSTDIYRALYLGLFGVGPD
jgi:alkaline phosphatase